MSLKHALLAMLDIDEGSGYDLMKRFDQSIGFFWPSTFQQVYRDLGALEQQGYVNSTQIEQNGKPDKKIYTITDSGINELEHWLRKPSRQMKIKDTFLIKMFGSRRLSKQELLHDLEQQRQQHQSALDCYQDIAGELKRLEEPLRSKYLLPFQVLDLGIRFEKTWLEWCADTRETLLDLDDVFTGDNMAKS